MSQALRDQIADELCGGAPPEQVARVRKVARTVGNIAEQLQTLGLVAQDVLQACCAVTGLPPAPNAWLRQPKLATAPGLDLEQCRRLGVVPLFGPANRLCIVFCDPELGADSAALGLPAHRAYLALPADLTRVRALLPELTSDEEPSTTVGGRAGRTASELRTALPAASARSADPLDELQPDGETIVTTTIPPPHDGGGGDDASSEDGPLFEDATSAVPAFSLPSAPKPAPRQKAEVANSAPVASGGDASADGIVTARMPLPSPARRAPSLATPADGTLASSGDDLDDALAAKPTIVTGPGPLPAEPAKVRSSPSGKRPAAPSPSGKRPAAPSPSGKRPAAPRATTASPSADRRPAPPGKPPSKPLMVDDGAPTEFTPQPPLRRPLAEAVTAPNDQPVANTEQRALAALSAEDLLDDDERSRADANTADAPSLELDYDKVPPRASTRPPSEEPQTSYGAAVADAGADAQEAMSAVVAAAKADDQESGAHQKQRMKRIAQIAAVKRYKIDRVLGRGGMATVYLATDTRTGRSCALKLMEPHLAEDEIFVERFKREIKASISLSHENIVGVFDFGEENGTYYMASEYVDAGTVAALLKTLDRPLPPALAVPIMMGFLDGLGAAHAQGFVHRDLKPANLMLTSAGVVKIGDFGIAKAQTDSTLTKTGALFGTPAYMSPEQATGQELDGRSDLFAAGIIFYELLAGYNPYAHENPSTTMFAIARGQARPIFDANPTVPGAAEQVVMRLLEKDKAKRFQTAQEARDELMALADLLSKKHPGAVAAATKDPVGAAEELSKAQASMEVERAQRLLKRVPPESAEACFRYYKATLLDANSFDAMHGLTQLRAEYGFRFTRPDDKQLLELEAALEKKPDQPAVLRRLADLSASHRNLVDMAGFAKRYLRYQPGDTHMQGRLERVIGPDPLAPFSRLAIDNAAELAQQAVGASDDMRDAARAAADDEAMSSRGAALKPSLRPGGRAAAQSRDSTPSNPPTPGTLELDEVGPRKSRHAAGGVAAFVGASDFDAPPPPPPASELPEEPEELPPARDSFEAAIRLLRQAWRDTVRSLTGDRGVKAVKAELRSRLEEGRREAKVAARQALQASKEAVRQNVLDEKGRKELQAQVKKHGRVGLRRHWRLALVLVILWGLLIGAGKACHMLCSDPEPQVAAPTQPAKLTVEKPPTSANDQAAKPDPEAEAHKKAPIDVAADQDRPDPPEPAVAAPPPPPAGADPGLVDLGKKQMELRQRAKAESDTGRAVALYTQAIDIDPYSVGARDALLERARLALAEGDLEPAERDIFALKRRPDVAALRADIEQMLADLTSAKKALESAAPEP